MEAKENIPPQSTVSLGTGDSLVPDHSMSAVLAIKPFRQLWVVLGLSSLGDWLGLLALTGLAQSLTTESSGKFLAVSGIFFLRLAPAAVLGPIAGILADRLPRRWILVVGDIVRCLLFCSIPLVATLWWLFVATVLIEVVSLMWLPAKDATVPTLVPRSRLEAANQLGLAATYGSAPIAALVFSFLTLANGVLDGWIPQLAGSPVYFALYINALTFAASAFVLWRVDLPEARGLGARQEAVWRTAMQGWRFISQTPLIRGLVLGMLGAFAAGGVVMSLARLYVSDLRAGDPGYGVLFSAVFLGLAAGMWLAPRALREFPRKRLFGLAIMVAGAWLFALSVIPVMAVAAVMTFFLGCATGTAWVTGYTLLGLEVGEEIQGRTFAFVQSMARIVLVGVLALAPLIAIGLTEAFDLPQTANWSRHFSLTYTGTMAVFGIFGLSTILAGYIAFRQMDDRPEVPLWHDLRKIIRPTPDPEVLAGQMSTGRLIAFEGGDGSGKSTHAALVDQWLQERGFAVCLTREPGATAVGRHLREVLLHGEELTPRAEALLFCADRAQHVESEIRPALAEGKVVLTDRYTDSSIAYQGYGRGLDPEQVADVSRWAAQGLTADLTIVLDLSADEAATRRGDQPDRMEAAPREFHERVRAGLLSQAHGSPSRYCVVDASQPTDQVQATIRRCLERVLPESPVDRRARLAREEAARFQAQQEAEAAEAARIAAAEAAAAQVQAAQAQAEAERAARAAKEEQIRRQAQAALQARRAVEQKARLERAEFEAKARAERERAAAQARAQAAAQASVKPVALQPPAPPTKPLPQVGLGSATARPKRTRAPAVPPSPPAAIPAPERSLGDEIFGLGERDQS